MITAYTDLTLAEYMQAVTRNVAAALGWSADDFAEAVTDALIAYGVTDLEDATNIPKLRALARVEAWRAVADGTAADYNFSADGGTYSREQLHKHAVEALGRALERAAAYGGTDAGYAIEMGSMTFTDAYGRSADEELQQ